MLPYHVLVDFRNGCFLKKFITKILSTFLVSPVEIHAFLSWYPMQHCYMTCLNNKPNVVVEWLTLKLRIREVPRLKLGPETGYADRGYRGFPQSLHANS
jgi:hypothetical protein